MTCPAMLAPFAAGAASISGLGAGFFLSRLTDRTQSLVASLLINMNTSIAGGEPPTNHEIDREIRNFTSNC